MSNDMMDLRQLASYLQRDVRELSKMASRGHLPGHKVGGQWRFAPAEINHWLETQMPDYTEQQLTAVETGPGRGDEGQPLVTGLLTETTIAVPLPATTRTSVLKELVNVAERSWQVYDGAAMPGCPGSKKALHRSMPCPGRRAVFRFWKGFCGPAGATSCSHSVTRAPAWNAHAVGKLDSLALAASCR